MTEKQEEEIQRLLQCEEKKAGPFVLLGIADDDVLACTTATVKKRYAELVLLLHPDKCALPQAAHAFHLVETAYQLLSDEAALGRLQRAFFKRAAQAREEEEEQRTSAAATKSQPSSSSSAAPSSWAPATALAEKGISSDAQKAAEIERVLRCRPTDYFTILDVNPDTCEVGDVARRYRRMAQALHPDKCALPRVADAFTRFEKAHKELADEKQLVRFKIAHAQQRKKAAALAAGRRAAGATAAGGAGGGGVGVANTAEERKRALLREQQLEAARLADEADRKRRKTEADERERAELSAMLQQQRKAWDASELL